MKRLLQTVLTAGASRALAPTVIGFFFILYIGIAFFTDETLITLMALTRKSAILAAVLALIPLNSALRILHETLKNFRLRRLMSAEKVALQPEMFDETVELPVSPSFPNLQICLGVLGYATRRSDDTLTAWRGIRSFPARILFLLGTLCLFSGILISITTRTSHRHMLIEGEALPSQNGDGGRVERITLANSTGPILLRSLTMEVAPSSSGIGKKSFGIYPPSLYGEAFVYPRYLGLDLLLRFTAPDLPTGYVLHTSLNCYPPGKEDIKPLSGTPYRIVFSVPEPDAAYDRYISYMTGNITLNFKLLKGQELLFSGSAPRGGEFVRDGYRVTFPEIKRLVVTDLIGDYGVFFIWGATLFFFAAGVVWLPIRVFYPRREMLFRYESNVTSACSRAEGGARKHAGVFHEALDLVDARKPDSTVD